MLLFLVIRLSLMRTILKPIFSEVDSLDFPVPPKVEQLILNPSKTPILLKLTAYEFWLKELRHSLRILKSLAFSFQIRRLQSVSIFSILCHPCSFIVYHYLFDVFLPYLTVIFKFPTI